MVSRSRAGDLPARSFEITTSFPNGALNLSVPPYDQVQAALGISCMKTVRPDNSDPIPLRAQPQHVGTIMIRFVGLLLAAVVVLALIWSR
jgi:hypothetical protein